MNFYLLIILSGIGGVLASIALSLSEIARILKEMNEKH